MYSGNKTTILLGKIVNNKICFFFHLYSNRPTAIKRRIQTFDTLKNKQTKKHEICTSNGHDIPKCIC